MSTKTRFEKGAEGNSEIAYLHLFPQSINKSVTKRAIINISFFYVMNADN